MEIPAKFLSMPEIGYEELLSKVRAGETLDGYSIKNDAVDALNRALFEDNPVKLVDCLIDGNLDFTKGPCVPIGEVPWEYGDVVILTNEMRGRLEEKGVKGGIWLKSSIEIKNSFINGRVLCGFENQRISIIFPAVNFFGSHLGHDAFFLLAAFGEMANFSDTTFGNCTNFSGATFGDGTNFRNATFGNEAEFEGVTFGNGANFISANFGNEPEFNHTTFGKEARFWRASFGRTAGFIEANFGERVGFYNAIFGEDCAFTGANFGIEAKFEWATFGDGASFQAATFRGSTVFLGQRKREGKEEIPVFNGTVDFRYLKLESPKEVLFQHVDLSEARFLNTPLDEVKFTDVDWNRDIRPGKRAIFDEIYVEEENYELVAQLYRQLKKNYEEARNYPGAGDFHYGEMEMTRRMHWAKGDWFNGMLTEAYKFLSGYGEAPGWSMYILLWIWVLPSIIGYMPPIMEKKLAATSVVNNVAQDPFFSGLLSSLLVSIKAMSLRLPDLALRVSGQIVAIGQAILGPIQLALVALALRRKFRR